MAASQALEDETLASGERRLVLGAFQQGHRYETSQTRWDELARTAAWCAVVADFDDVRGELDADPEALPARCHLPQDAPMRREWTVVSIGEAFGAVVSAWEVPGPPQQPALYEAVISTRREVAVVAARVITAVAEAAGAEPTDQVRGLLSGAHLAPTTSPEAADRVWLRALGNLDRVER